MPDGTLARENGVFRVLTVYVKSANGQPAVNATVLAFTSDNHIGDWALTGQDGYAYLDLSPGVYDIVTYSRTINFFLYRTNVSPPGSIKLTAVGASQVTLTARITNNQFLTDAYISVGVTGGTRGGEVGKTNTNGEVTFHVTPGVYDVGVEKYNSYALYRITQDFTNPNNSVVFDMSVDPHGILWVQHPDDSNSWLLLDTIDANLGGF